MTQLGTLALPHLIKAFPEGAAPLILAAAELETGHAHDEALRSELGPSDRIGLG